MSLEINTEFKIPDLWFDFYVRFLPGTLFVSFLYILWPGEAIIPSGWSSAILVFVGYITGLLVQPISSELTGLLHRFMGWVVTRDSNFVHKQKHLDPLRILSKMHGETTFFVQCFFLSTALFILERIPYLQLECSNRVITTNIVFVFFVFVMALDVEWRRVRRAERLKKYAMVSIQGEQQSTPAQ